MRLDQLFRSGQPEISIELFPPKTPEATEKLFETVETLKALNPVFFSMTYGAGGSTRDTTFELCDRLKNNAGTEVMCHLSIVGQSKEDTRNNLRHLKSKGVYNLLALRGDAPQDDPEFKPHPDGFTASAELVEAARKEDFSVAVTGFPEVHLDAKDRASDIAYLKRKVDAGGCVVITQLFFDNNFFFEFMEHVDKAGINVPVVPGILPILSAGQVRRFSKLCGSSIPKAVDEQLSKYEDDDAAATEYGIELATQQCEGLIQAGVPGLHFYALNRVHSTQTILKNLNLA